MPKFKVVFDAPNRVNAQLMWIRGDIPDDSVVSREHCPPKTRSEVSPRVRKSITLFSLCWIFGFGATYLSGFIAFLSGLFSIGVIVAWVCVVASWYVEDTEEINENPEH